MKQEEIKLEKEKAKQKLVGPETEVRGFAASDLNLWSLSPSTMAMGLETKEARFGRPNP